jgi:hypothetical protein
VSRENTDLPRREFLTALGALGIAGASLGPTATLVRGVGRKASGARHLVQHADHFGLFEAEIDHGVLTRVIPFAKDPKPTPMVQTLPNRVYLLLEAEGEILTFFDFPPEHRRQIYSTNPLERLNKGLKRRSAVVGIFPNRSAVLRLFGALLAEQNDEWLVAGHRYMSEISMRKLFSQPEEEVPPQIEAKTA